MTTESKQNLASKLVKRFVLAWDRDYTKLTSAERVRLEASERDLKKTGFKGKYLLGGAVS